jgi:hypothetical protein
LGAFTEAEIQAKITAYSNAIDAVMLGQTYSIDTGQGRQSVTRASLGMLERGLAMWERRLRRIQGRSGIVAIRAVRK